MSPSGARLVDSWLAGEPVDMGAEACKLQRQLVAAGLLHPVVEAEADWFDGDEVGFVVPVFNDAKGLADVLAAIRGGFSNAPIIVVDDASHDPGALPPIVESVDANLILHDVNQGPAAARNTGWRAMRASVRLVVFVDSDVVPDIAGLGTLLAHFDDPTVSAAAPRVRAKPGTSLLDRYEVVESPLDLGDKPAVVRPGGSVPYVPSTLLAVRSDALHELDGFDESLRVGEDVDFIRRVVRAGDVVRYEPRAVAHHRNRPSWSALLRQRHNYGTAAADLERRHPGDVAPIELPPQTLLAWSLAWLGGPLGLVAGIAIGLRDAVGLCGRLADRVDDPDQETLRLTVMSQAHAGRWLARAVTRVWLPFVGLLALFSRRARRVLLASITLPAVATWWQKRPAIDPASYVVARAVDDAAYGSGVWRGMIAARSLRPLVPRTAKRLKTD